MKFGLFMQTFLKDFDKELVKCLRKIEQADVSVFEKAREASVVLENAFRELKGYVSDYRFKNEEEEIEFFKETKPMFFSLLIYYRKVYDVELNRPFGVIAQQEYLQREMEEINRYYARHADFLRYYRSGETYLDDRCFLRGQDGVPFYVETHQYDRDEVFSTNCDSCVAHILAYERLTEYLNRELKALQQQQTDHSQVRMTWNGTKTELYELLYALDSCKMFGEVPLTQLAGYISTVFNIELDRNMSRTFGDMRIRNQQTPFLDSLKEALTRRMGGKSRKK